MRLQWIDRTSGKPYRITTERETGGANVARIQNYRDVLVDFLHHPEAKSAGLEGRPCDRPTVGQLGRRVVRSIRELTTHVGKESNRLEEVESGIEHNPEELWTEFADPGRDPWRTLLLPVLKQMPAKRLVNETGLAMSTVKATRNGHTKPHGRNQQALVHAVAVFARERLREFGIPSPADDLTCCAALLNPTTTEGADGLPPLPETQTQSTRSRRARRG